MENVLENGNTGEEEISGSNAGWADAIAKVLQSKKSKKSKSIVLSRAKKINDVPIKVKEESQGFNVIEHSNLQNSRKKIKELQSKFRMKPTILDRERERRLNRIATKGVVQLFNAVRKQQKNLQSELEDAGGSERKREKVMKSLDKRSFLNVLMGTARSEPVDNPVKSEPEETSTWRVLRDDFMMESSRLKDWDKTDNPT
ncbi:hypothetical protein L9F63_017603 [Diploptera punctata]|uniref:RRP15-like protein n=1 Tax=Diploptera punctata TaxID=6984 RepID=A0AAD7ZYC8_DIPPU|nr:hypothetical protein L9F63_017603 [Diploptera punctata]